MRCASVLFQPTTLLFSGKTWSLHCRLICRSISSVVFGGELGNNRLVITTTNHHRTNGCQPTNAQQLLHRATDSSIKKFIRKINRVLGNSQVYPTKQSIVGAQPHCCWRIITKIYDALASVGWASTEVVSPTPVSATTSSTGCSSTSSLNS